MALDSHTTLHALLSQARLITGFTGAGISTECGVPDFRSPGSPWLVHKPVDFGDFIRNPDLRREAWRRKFIMDDLYAGARPGRTHQALARMMKMGRMAGIITQNIDGLHQASGIANHQLAELHGNGSYATCLDCGLRYELPAIRAAFEAQDTAPVCECGGLIKSATISFGQPVPAAVLQRAQAMTLACDLFLVLGSSLRVRPAAQLPEIAKRNGALLVIINREPTPLDGIADLTIHGDVGALMQPFSK